MPAGCILVRSNHCIVQGHVWSLHTVPSHIISQFEKLLVLIIAHFRIVRQNVETTDSAIAKFYRPSASISDSFWYFISAKQHPHIYIQLTSHESLCKSQILFSGWLHLPMYWPSSMYEGMIFQTSLLFCGIKSTRTYHELFFIVF